MLSRPNTRSKVGGTHSVRKLAQLWNSLFVSFRICCFCVGERKLWWQFDQARSKKEWRADKKLSFQQLFTYRPLQSAMNCFILSRGRTRIRQTAEHKSMQRSPHADVVLRCRDRERERATQAAGVVVPLTKRTHTRDSFLIALIISACCLPPRGVSQFSIRSPPGLKSKRGAVFFRIQRAHWAELKNDVFRCKIHKLFQPDLYFSMGERSTVCMCTVEKSTSRRSVLCSEFFSRARARSQWEKVVVPVCRVGQCGRFLYTAPSATTIVGEEKKWNRSWFDCEKFKRCTHVSTWSAAANYKQLQRSQRSRAF